MVFGVALSVVPVYCGSETANGAVIPGTGLAMVGMSMQLLVHIPSHSSNKRLVKVNTLSYFETHQIHEARPPPKFCGGLMTLDHARREKFINPPVSRSNLGSWRSGATRR
jgi:hypothetical protein